MMARDGKLQGEVDRGQSRAKVGSALEKRRRNSVAKRGGPMTIWTKAMLASVVGVALVAVICSGGGHKDTHPSLRKFLEHSAQAAKAAFGDNAESTCTDPKRWLNPAGQGLLADLPGLAQHNDSMLWGTYRPGVYFGFKTRTSPVSVTAGLMWHGGDGRAGVESLRHECREGDGLGPYGWLEHDGVSHGKQGIVDNRAGVRLVTSMVKPAQLSVEADDQSTQVNIASRVEVLPLQESNEGTAKEASSARLTTLYFYVGLDCGSVKEECAQLAGNGGMVVVDSDLHKNRPRRSLLMRGMHPETGGFDIEATVLHPDGATSEEVSVSYAGQKDLPVVDVKGWLEKRHNVHRRTRRKGDYGKGKWAMREPFLLSDGMDDGSNVAFVQVTARAPFTVDFIVRPSDGGANARPTRSAIPSSAVTNWLSTGTRLFSERFRDTFSLKEKGFNDEDVTAAKSALSNMLGGMGYFTGRSKIKHAGAGSGDDSGGDRGREVDDGFSFETSLFTAVPSRSFFPRGFLWDEGFHQLLISAWNKKTSIDVLSHWLSVMHVHGSGGVIGEGCSGGWLPREQILGEEARRRVPAEFVAQDVSVANPPTLLLLVESLLGDLPVRGEDLQENAAGVCTGTGDTSESDTPGGCSAVAAELEDDDDEEGTALAKAFLRRSHPLLDRWMQWLLITQRPGAKGWGGQAKRVPLGAFQWRGRDPHDERLNALTLASGLDDYPRASHPSDDEEWHVDVLSWLALGCRVMDGLSAAVGVTSVPYGDMFEEMVGGMFDIHWDQDAEAFFDRGNHVSDGELTDEVLMRCRKADGTTVDIGAKLEDVQARRPVCAPGQQHMYPLGDGRGGLLMRRRWRGGTPKPQHVPHIGYVSIFPLLLKLLPPDSHAVGSILARVRDPTELWSVHGLRSLSASDPFYQIENNPGDEPYWRGHIWVNVNYLALGALRHYGEAEGPFRKEAARTYTELRTNLLRTLLDGYRNTGYFWEQYDDRSGYGLRSHPFTGWTALVVLIMAEIY